MTAPLYFLTFNILRGAGAAALLAGWCRYTKKEAVSQTQAPMTQARPPSYVRLAMRNMVRQGRKSLVHFTLTSLALVGVLVGLAYLTRH